VHYEIIVPTVSDRIAQTVVKLLIEPTLEPIFHPDSYGYRPGRSAKQAIAVTKKRCWQYDWVVELTSRRPSIKSIMASC
jgi:retron-type reverse transcriptase